MRNHLQPEGNVKPTHHKTITVTYNIPRPDFSGTSYKPGEKAGETNSITPGEKWYQVMESDKATLEAVGQLLSGNQTAKKIC